MQERSKIYLVALALAWLGFGCGDGGGDAAPLEGFVCGVDGETYSVEEAAREEHAVEHRGRCDQPMKCESDAECFVGDECAGWCVPGPAHCNCPGVFEPVCGGDGRNYVNACEAACAGVGIQHDDYCEEPPGRGCVRAGCSGQLCIEEGMDVASTCEWRPVYECYQQATCERQQNGQCGFTPTHELVECLEGVPSVGDCRTLGCDEGWTCDFCRTADGDSEWICLPPEAGACEPPVECRPTGCNGEICASEDVPSPCAVLPEFTCYEELGICGVQPWGECGWTNTPELDECLSQFDCRAEGCGEGDYCTFCWFSWECIPEGAVC